MQSAYSEAAPGVARRQPTAVAVSVGSTHSDTVADRVTVWTRLLGTGFASLPFCRV
jgi:hypothetical protein